MHVARVGARVARLVMRVVRVLSLVPVVSRSRSTSCINFGGLPEARQRTGTHHYVSARASALPSTGCRQLLARLLQSAVKNENFRVAVRVLLAAD